MLNFTKKTVKSTRKFVTNHKTAIAFIAGAGIGVYINRQNLKEWNAFLDANDLQEAYLNRFQG